MTIIEEAFAGRPLACNIIDAHTHIGPYHMSGWHQKYDRVDVDVVLKDMSRLGIDCIVTAPHPMIQERMEEANRIAAQAAKEYPGKIYGYISIVPSCGMDAVKKELKMYRDNPSFLGLKFLAGYHGDLLQPEYEYAMDFADEMGCPVLCHEYNNIPDRKEFEEALKTRHHMQLIIAHQGGAFAADTRDCAHIIRDHENAWMDICGSLDNSLPVEAMVDLVGEDKLIFGTDAINLDPKYEIGKVAFSKVAVSVKKKIFSENYLSMLQSSCMGKIK